MNTPAIDPAFVDFGSALYVRMSEDYTTETFNLGERTYIAGFVYRVDSHLLDEISASGTGRAFTREDVVVDPEIGYVHPAAYCVIRPQVSVLAKITRWFTSNGKDTHYLTADMVSQVPSNLAAWLIEAGHAVAA